MKQAKDRQTGPQPKLEHLKRCRQPHYYCCSLLALQGVQLLQGHLWTAQLVPEPCSMFQSCAPFARFPVEPKS